VDSNGGTPARHRPLVAIVLLGVIAVGAWMLAGPGGALSRSGPRFDGPLPACGRAEILTPHREAEDWRLTFLDPAFTLADSDAPTDLVSVGKAGISGRGTVRRVVVDDLRAMDRAARADEVTLVVRSAYRSFDAQVATFASLERAYGRDYALASAARPGHSEHQLGTALDIDGGDHWLADQGWRYGFVVSYPPEWSPQVTCYKAEPWHVRYIGREAASALHDSGLSLREWLWDRQG
jgi:D-alanyl-D-alanine carboxypeptidase